MSISILLGLLLALLLVQILVSAGSIWIVAKILRVGGTTFSTCLRITGCVFAVNLLALPITIWLSNQGVAGAIINNAVFALVLLLATTIGVLVVYWWIFKRGLQCSGKKAVAVTTIWLLVSTSIGLGLAFTFRKYACEAFVVPSGSMATNIIGTHCNVVCENCGYEYSVSMSDRFDEKGRMRQLVGIKHATCPNCGHGADLDDLADIAGGDRVIVDKASSPKRWDAAVYRQPQDRSIFYVHRLVGLPGENFAIADGDVFIDGTRLSKKPDELLDLWFPVHDTSFIPKTTDENAPRWESENGHWKSNKRSWSFSGAAGGSGSLKFQGKLTDRLAYNAQTIGGFMGDVEAEDTPVGDIQVVCNVAHFSGEGPWEILWEFDGRTVKCELLPNRKVTLTAQWQNQPKGNASDALTSSGQLPKDAAGSSIGLAVRDGFAYVLENGRPCLSLQIASPQLEDVPRHLALSSGTLSVQAENCELVIERIQIARDVYYVHPDGPGKFLAWERYSKQLGSNECFLLGDNSTRAADSRYRGPSQMNDIIGIARFRYWPPNRWHAFH